MRRLLDRSGVALSALLALASAASLALAAGESGAADRALRGAVRAHQAEVAVLRAQEGVGGTDVGEALAAIRRANQAAQRVSVLTEELVGSLEPTADEASAAVASAREAATAAALVRRETGLVGGLLAAIAEYQSVASDASGTTNDALRRILAALRETNRDFGGAP